MRGEIAAEPDRVIDLTGPPLPYRFQESADQGLILLSAEVQGPILEPEFRGTRRAGECAGALRAIEEGAPGGGKRGLAPRRLIIGCERWSRLIGHVSDCVGPTPTSLLDSPEYRPDLLDALAAQDLSWLGEVDPFPGRRDPREVHADSDARIRRHLRNYLQPHIGESEGEDVSRLLDLLRGGCARAMTRTGLDPDQRRVRTTLRCLQGSGELEGVARYDPVVMIGGRDEGRGITGPWLEVVEW